MAKKVIIDKEKNCREGKEIIIPVLSHTKKWERKVCDNIIENMNKNYDNWEYVFDRIKGEHRSYVYKMVKK